MNKDIINILNHQEIRFYKILLLLFKHSLMNDLTKVNKIHKIIDKLNNTLSIFQRVKLYQLAMSDDAIISLYYCSILPEFSEFDKPTTIHEFNFFDTKSYLLDVENNNFKFINIKKIKGE